MLLCRLFHDTGKNQIQCLWMNDLFTKADNWTFGLARIECILWRSKMGCKHFFYESSPHYSEGCKVSYAKRFVTFWYRFTNLLKNKYCFVSQNCVRKKGKLNTRFRVKRYHTFILFTIISTLTKLYYCWKINLTKMREHLYNYKIKRS